MLKTVSVIFGLGMLQLAAAYSSGQGTGCDAWAGYGCASSDWINNDRKKCRKPHHLMDWAGSPFHSSNYSIRAGDGAPGADKTAYTPDIPMAIDIRVLHPAMKWRGILLHAVNHKNITVGSWRLLKAGDGVFQTAACPGALLHTHADEKPFHVGAAHFVWVPPAKGTGPVTFRTLLKQGPANIGEFYYPEKDLVLLEAGNENWVDPNQPTTPTSNSTNSSNPDATVPVPSPAPSGGSSIVVVDSGPATSWHVAPVGMTCDTLCKSKDTKCDMDGMKTDASQFLTSALEGVYECGVAFRDCSLASPGVDANGQCYFHASDCTASELALANNMAAATDAEATVCSATSAARHFCLCSAAFSRAAPSLFSFLLSAALGFFFVSGGRPKEQRHGASSSSSGFSFKLLGGVFLLAMLAHPVRGHNWMQARSRNTKIARAGRICDPRKQGETHVQVGPDQQFAVQWATGHSRHSFVVVMREEDDHIMTNSSYLKMVQQYLDEAPTGSDLMPKNSKYHRLHVGSSSLLNAGPSSGENQPNPFDKEYPLATPATRNALWNTTHPDTFKITSYKYLQTFKATTIAKDQHISYKSAKFPWFEAVHKYEQAYSRGSDSDVAKVHIPGFNCNKTTNKESCHYVVHWYWSGYNDCVDVDYFHSKSEGIQEVYGIEAADAVQYEKVDHCSYIEPLQGLSQCRILPPSTDNYTTSAEVCKQELLQHPYYKVARGVPFLDETWRFGVNVVPVRAPPAVSFPETVKKFLPWNRGWCAGEATQLKGGVSVSFDDWTTWTAKTTFTEKKTCAIALWSKNMTFRDAVAECDADYRKDCSQEPTNSKRINCVRYGEDLPKVCFGLASPVALLTAQMGGVHLFTGCGSAALNSTTSKSTGVAFMKKATSLKPMPAKTGPVMKFSFQRATDPMVRGDGSPATDFAVESGQVFGTRDNNFKYGWNCVRNVGYGDMSARRTTNKILPAWVKSVDSTYASITANIKCPDGNDRLWQVEVPDGVYRIKSRHNWGDLNLRQFSQFVFEDRRLAWTDITGIPSWQYPRVEGHNEVVTYVEVTDGNLTMRVTGPIKAVRGFSTFINTLEIQKVGDAGSQTPAWMPSNANPWWQQTLPQPEPVGLVKIDLPGPMGPNIPCKAAYSNCDSTDYERANPVDNRASWFFKGNSNGRGGGTALKNASLVAGVFDGPDEGAIVAVTNVPFVPGMPYMMPPASQICARIKNPPLCNSPMLKDEDHLHTTQYPRALSYGSTMSMLCPLEVDCAGKVGKYVQIILPGQNRILTLGKVEVHRAEPEIKASVNGQYPLACYAVEARRPGTLPFPQQETIGTDDPEDITFYSTCYVRNKIIDWLPTKKEAPKDPEFVFHGQCLACDSFKENLNITSDYNHTLMGVPQWMTSSKCSNCEANYTLQGLEESPLAVSTSAVAAEDPLGIRQPGFFETWSGVGTIAGIVVVFVLLIGFFVWRKRKSAMAAGRALEMMSLS